MQRPRGMGWLAIAYLVSLVACLLFLDYKAVGAGRMAKRRAQRAGTDVEARVAELQSLRRAIDCRRPVLFFASPSSSADAQQRRALAQYAVSPCRFLVMDARPLPARDAYALIYRDYPAGAVAPVRFREVARTDNYRLLLLQGEEP